MFYIKSLSRLREDFISAMDANSKSIVVAAALIDDGEGNLLLVRKANTQMFMQAGGKIENGEIARSALYRELKEEIGLQLDGSERYLGRFYAPAANEPSHTVQADVFHVRTQHIPQTGAEIAEAIWVSYRDAVKLPLAPLTRNSMLPLALTLPSRSASVSRIIKDLP